MCLECATLPRPQFHLRQRVQVINHDHEEGTIYGVLYVVEADVRWKQTGWHYLILFDTPRSFHDEINEAELCLVEEVN